MCACGCVCFPKKTGSLYVTSIEWTCENSSSLDRLCIVMFCPCTEWILFVCVLQVIDWIENHGEAFLSKHTGVGKSLHRARALQKRHDDFEEVAQVRRQLHPIRLIQNRYSQSSHPQPFRLIHISLI